MTRVACCKLESHVAVTVVLVDDDTGFVRTLNFPADEPTEITTLAATGAANLLVDTSATETAPPEVPGVALSVTTPAALVPPRTLAGVTDTEMTWNGLTVILVLWLTPA